MGLADTYYTLGDWGYLTEDAAAKKVNELIDKAWEIDPTLGEAHFTRGMALFTYKWDYDGAGEAFRRGLEMAPDYAIGHHWYAQYLQAVGPLDDALAEANKALAQDLMSPTFILTRGYIYFFLRRYDDAINDYLRALDIDENLPIRVGLACIYQSAGLPERAVQEVAESLRRGGAKPEVVQEYLQAFESGRKVGADRWLAERWEKLGGDPTAIAGMYAILHEIDTAFTWLDRAYAQRSSLLLTALNFHPALDGVRSDPRYDELRKKMKLPRRGAVPTTQPAASQAGPDTQRTQ